MTSNGSNGSAALTEVTGCPCGQIHHPRTDAYAAWQRVTAGHPATTVIHALGAGAWAVPRIYLLCHRLAAAELPELAQRYGWAKVA